MELPGTIPHMFPESSASFEKHRIVMLVNVLAHLQLVTAARNSDPSTPWYITRILYEALILELLLGGQAPRGEAASGRGARSYLERHRPNR